MRKTKLILLTVLVALLAVFAVGCGAVGDDRLEGKSIVTFELNGGMLKYGTSSTRTNINFAYYPGTRILDPSKDISNYELSRSGYNFTGWYTSEDCKANEKWNFNDYISVDTLTLWAGWEKAVKYTFDVYYVDGEGNDVALGSWSAKEGGTLPQSLAENYASTRKGYTQIGFYADRELTEEWDFSTKHPGGDTDRSIPVYVKYIDGEWSLVSNFAALKKALNDGKNIYLTEDIDCQGNELSFKGKGYGGILEGNGFSISGFTVNASSGVLTLKRCAIFESLAATAVIRNVSFTDASYVVEVAVDGEVTVEVATLALSAEQGALISGVSVSGSFITNYGGELPAVDGAVLSGDATVENYTADLQIALQ